MTKTTVFLFLTMFLFEVPSFASDQTSGLGFDFTYKGEVGRILRGSGKNTTSYLENIDFKVSLDTEAQWGTQTGKFFLYALSNRGISRPGQKIGNFQGVSNIETKDDAIKIYELYWEKSFSKNQFSVLLGLHDLNSEFYVTSSSSLFINPSFGIGSELAQTGINGPSIFPSTSLAARIKTESEDGLYLQSAVFNDPAGDPENPKSSFTLRRRYDDALLFIAETGFAGKDQDSRKYAVGFWTYNKPSDHQTLSEKSTKNGAYILIDQPVTEATSAFFRYGVANAKDNSVVSNGSLGFQCKGLLGARPEDDFGIAYTQVSPSAENKESLKADGVNVANLEQVVEFTYRAEIFKNFYLQPSYQIIANSNFNKDEPTSEFVALRTELSF